MAIETRADERADETRRMAHRVRIRRRGRPAGAALALAVTAALAGAAWPGAAAAGTPVYADPAGTCGGLTPCFATLQDAVDHAAPAPATVGLFPGTYAESVDLDSMGSAAGGGPGELALQALDAGGMPTVGGVLIDPGGSGGPGTGPGLIAGALAAFPGGVALRGIGVTSPDAVGFGLRVVGDVTLEDLVIQGCGDNGGVVFVDGPGTATVRRVVALLNAGGGLLVAAAQVTAEDLVADRNGSTGAGLGGDGPVAVRRIHASGNGEAGFGAVSCTSVEIEDATADANGTDGAEVLVGPDLCEVMLADRGGFDAAWRAVLPRDPLRLPARPAPPRPVQAGAVPVVVTINGLVAGGNGALGVGIFAGQDEMVIGGVAVDDVVADGNGRFGLQATGEEVRITNAGFAANLSGAVVGAVLAEVDQVTASDNAPAVFTPPLEGAGVYVGAAVVADLAGLVAERNAFAGLVLDSTVAQPGVALYRVDGGRFAGNGAGIATTGGGALDVEIAGAEASGNAAAGLALPDVRQGTVRAAVATGNAVGVTANVAAALEVRESEIAANQEGLLLVVQPGATARVQCSNVRGNAPGAGLRLLSGAAADARANFWGDPSGPAHPGNPGGLGDPAVDGANGGDGTVDYTGFLAAPATAGDCIEPSAVEIPAAGVPGLALLAALVALAGLAALHRAKRPAPGSSS